MILSKDFQYQYRSKENVLRFIQHIEKHLFQSEYVLKWTKGADTKRLVEDYPFKSL